MTLYLALLKLDYEAVVLFFKLFTSLFISQTL